jgi:hypothetical protein
MSCYSAFRLADYSEDIRTSLAEYFVTRYEVQQDDCWRWTGAISRGGYGQAHACGIQVAAHRLAYELFVGPISGGLVLDHLCRQRWCCNPEHVEPVTQAENIRRGLTGHINATKTHCPYGHPYTADNTYVIPATGARACRTCAARRRRAYDQQRRFARAG